MIKASDIQYKTVTKSVSDIIERIEDFNIVVLNENYSEEVRDFIITNLLLRIPLDRIYLKYKENKFHVIDSIVFNVIYDFVNGKTKYNSKIDGISDSYFDELPNHIKRRINETYIDMIYFDYDNESTNEYIEILKNNRKETCL